MGSGPSCYARHGELCLGIRQRQAEGEAGSVEPAARGEHPSAGAVEIAERAAPGLAHDLGTVTASTEPVVFAVGHTRDPVIQYIIINNAIQTRSSYFWTKYGSFGDAVRCSEIL